MRPLLKCPAMRTAARATLPLASACLLSGAAALVYQVLWTRQLALLRGLTVAALSTVLATFMAGLACGSAPGRPVCRARARRFAATSLCVPRARHRRFRADLPLAASRRPPAPGLALRIGRGVSAPPRVGAPRPQRRPPARADLADGHDAASAGRAHGRPRRACGARRGNAVRGQHHGRGGRQPRLRFLPPPPARHRPLDAPGGGSEPGGGRDRRVEQGGAAPRPLEPPLASSAAAK